MLLPFLKKNTDEVASEKRGDARVVEEHTPLEEFIPYYSHYDPHTLLTKNGELLQVIKIVSSNSGLNYESGETEDSTVRANIRKAIRESLKTDNFSLWIHTIRKRKPITYHAKFKESFAEHTQKAWQHKHPWKYQYYNEIYVSVLYDGQPANLMDMNDFKQAFLPKYNRTFRNRFLDQSYKKLDRAVSDMLEDIRDHYNARRLTMVERLSSKHHQAVFYSEPMEFLGTLMNLRVREYPVTEADISSVIRPHTLTFGFNALEAKNATGKRRFGAILTLKQYREIPPETADRILQAPIELIVSQSFSFITYGEVLSEYKKQKELFEMSEDEYSSHASGLEELLAANKQTPTDYGDHQTSIMIMTDEFKALDAEVGKLQSAFGELGLITIREDIRLEECYWAQMPGNFEFLRRKEVITTGNVSGFSRLNRFPTGANHNNHWGDAVIVIPTMVGSPYFFNFHVKDNGHTLLYDFNSFHDQATQVLLNFLLIHTRKYDSRLFIFDRDRSAHLLFDKLGGDYHRLNSHKKTGSALTMNPFLIEDSPRNRGFLLAWVSSLLPSSEINDGHKETLRTAVGQLYAQPAENRNLKAFIAQVASADPSLATAFAPWIDKGDYSGLFDGAQENLDLKHTLHAFDMNPVVKQKECIIPVFSYLLHRIIMGIDGKPTIIVLHDAWDLLENAFFAPRLESLLEMLKENNVMVIFTTKSPGDHTDTHTYATLKQSCATHIYVPDDITLDYASLSVGISEYESRMMHRMERQKGDFLLKQGAETVGLRINLENMDDIQCIAAGDVKNLIAAGGPYATLPKAE